MGSSLLPGGGPSPLERQLTWCYGFGVIGRESRLLSRRIPPSRGEVRFTVPGPLTRQTTVGPEGMAVWTAL
jgi:hypothetical protein